MSKKKITPARAMIPMIHLHAYEQALQEFGAGALFYVLKGTQSFGNPNQGDTEVMFVTIVAGTPRGGVPLLVNYLDMTDYEAPFIFPKIGGFLFSPTDMDSLTNGLRKMVPCNDLLRVEHTIEQLEESTWEGPHQTLRHALAAGLSGCLDIRLQDVGPNFSQGMVAAVSPAKGTTAVYRSGFVFHTSMERLIDPKQNGWQMFCDTNSHPKN